MGKIVLLFVILFIGAFSEASFAANNTTSTINTINAINSAYKVAPPVTSGEKTNNVPKVIQAPLSAPIKKVNNITSNTQSPPSVAVKKLNNITQGAQSSTSSAIKKVNNSNSTPAAQTPVYTTFSQCIRTYPLSTENLLYTCLTALSQNNYQIKEIQFRTGTILFSVNSKEFILTTARKDIKNSFIKILPSDNNYNFSPIVINKVFNYIDLNYGLGVQNLI